MSEELPSPDRRATPDGPDIAPFISSPRTGSWALTALLLLAILTLLHLARDVVLPIVAALILSLVFLPAVRGMKKLRIPAPLGAAVVVFCLVAALVGGAYNLARPAEAWLNQAPQNLHKIGVKLRYITGQVNVVAQATNKVQDMTQDMTQGGDRKRGTQEVIVKTPTLADGIFTGARSFALSTISTLVLLYLLLASGDLFLRKTIAATPRLDDKQRAVDIAEQVEVAVSSYLFTVTIINITLGGAVALAMYLLGVPNPVLWGVMVGILNFIPYLGAIASACVLAAVGLLTFEDISTGLLVPAVFLLMTAAEGYLITPFILGQRLSLNPVVIMLSIMFWAGMWGIPGALLAVPILVTLKTLCDRVASLQVFGEFLGA